MQNRSNPKFLGFLYYKKRQILYDLIFSEYYIILATNTTYNTCNTNIYYV